MRIAALNDIHGNLPALEAVLQEIRKTEIDEIVVGGDVLPGPMPVETLECLLGLDRPVHFIHGNGELAVLAQMAAPEPGAASYWGTTSGRPLPEPLLSVYHWTAKRLQRDYERILARWPKTIELEVGGLGPVLFCHATPRSETEVILRSTPVDRLLPLFENLEASVVVCGHTHMQFDRRIGKTRVVNAGSVGEPFGAPGAYWALLGGDVELRHTSYDLARAAERIRASDYPLAEEFAASDLLLPPSESEMLEVFGRVELQP